MSKAYFLVLPRILNQRPLYFKQFQWRFNGATRNVQCVQGAYGESAFEELDEIFYIVQPIEKLPKWHF